ncbi:hypothetical protein M426DRAFT_100120 [Hypoxylon sp. CI-4A]|nr:hypothetical protein M426DRAFT_100120 [Hypoxylon sp. CI-4A]
MKSTGLLFAICSSGVTTDLASFPVDVDGGGSHISVNLIVGQHSHRYSTQHERLSASFCGVVRTSKENPRTMWFDQLGATSTGDVGGTSMFAVEISMH